MAQPDEMFTFWSLSTPILFSSCIFITLTLTIAVSTRDAGERELHEACPHAIMPLLMAVVEGVYVYTNLP